MTGREYHLCRVAGNTVSSAAARLGGATFANRYTAFTYLLTVHHRSDQENSNSAIDRKRVVEIYRKNSAISCI